MLIIGDIYIYMVIIGCIYIYTHAQGSQSFAQKKSGFHPEPSLVIPSGSQNLAVYVAQKASHSSNARTNRSFKNDL